MLALLTARQVTVWESDDTLWADATRQTPLAPRPWVNLALRRMAQGDAFTASLYLDQAAQLARGQSGADRTWTEDVIAANRAVLLVRQGSVPEAVALLAGAPPWMPRWQVCQRLSACRPAP